MKLWKYIFLIALASCSVLHAASVQKVDFYNEWYGNNCNYHSEKPFFFLNSLESFHTFWKSSNLKDEQEPYFDFDKYRVFVWNPGISRYDWSETKIEKFVYKDEALLVQIDFQKRYTGKKNRPFYAVLMPKRNDTDVFIFKKEKPNAKREIEWKHIFSIWSMNQTRSKPFSIVYADTDLPKKYVPLSSLPIDTAGLIREQANQNISAAPIEAPVTDSYQDNSYSDDNLFDDTGSWDNSAASSGSANTNNKSATAESVFGQDESIAELFGDIHKKDDKPTSFQAVSEKKPVPEAIPSMMEDDPLFGSEFDITF